MFEQYPLRFMFAFGLSIAAAASFGIAWFRASRRLRELEERFLGAPAPRHHLPQEPVADAIDNLAARLDDIANGQDFLNRVLSERLAKLPAKQSRELTPV